MSTSPPMSLHAEGARNGGHDPLVWIVSLDHWPRACLRAELIERGYDAVGFVTIPAAEMALDLPGAARPAAIIVDLEGQPECGEAMARLLRTRPRVIGIGGAVDAHSEELRAVPWTAFFQRPVALGALADVVEQVLRGHGRSWETVSP